MKERETESERRRRKRSWEHEKQVDDVYWEEFQSDEKFPDISPMK